MLEALGTEPTTGGMVHDSLYQDAVRRSGCSQGLDRHRSRRLCLVEIVELSE